MNRKILNIFFLITLLRIFLFDNLLFTKISDQYLHRFLLQFTEPLFGQCSQLKRANKMFSCHFVGSTVLESNKALNIDYFHFLFDLNSIFIEKVLHSFDILKECP